MALEAVPFVEFRAIAIVIQPPNTRRLLDKVYIFTIDLVPSDSRVVYL